MRRIVSVIALGAAAVGCSTVDPSAKLKPVSQAIEAAKSAGAANFPSSSELLASAQKYFGNAESMFKSGDVPGAMRNLNVASAAAANAKVTAVDAGNVAKLKDLDAQIASLKSRLGM